jgi:hypothetical protein
VKYEIRLSRRAWQHLDRLDKPAQKRMVRRLEQLAEARACRSSGISVLPQK